MIYTYIYIYTLYTHDITYAYIYIVFYLFIHLFLSFCLSFFLSLFFVYLFFVYVIYLFIFLFIYLFYFLFIHFFLSFFLSFFIYYLPVQYSFRRTSLFRLSLQKRSERHPAAPVQPLHLFQTSPPKLLSICQMDPSTTFKTRSRHESCHKVLEVATSASNCQNPSEVLRSSLGAALRHE